MSLTIGIRFLTGYCGTARSKIDPLPEWPPHPARLFMALAAAYFECLEGDADARNALQWLESLDPPSLHFSDRAVSENAATPAFVPMNDAKAVGKGGSIQTLPALKRHRAERLFPRTHLPPEEDCLYFTWENAAEKDLQHHQKALADLCGNVGRLGHSSSLVHVFITKESPAHLLIMEPTTARSELRMRTVSRTTGTLEQFAIAFTLPPFHPTMNSSHGYRQRPKPRPASATTLFDDRIEVLRLKPADTQFRSLQLETTLALASTLHKSILAHCPQPIPESISGHSPDGGPSSHPHIAIIPLAFVDQKHADGHLLGVGIVLPCTMEETAQQQLTQALDRIADSGDHQGQGLGFDRQKFPGLGQWKLLREGPFDDLRVALQTDKWTAAENGGATVWGSVTPVVYDQHGKAKNREAYLDECAASVKAAIKRVIPQDIGVEVRITPISVISGVPPARDFPRMTRKDSSERRHTHVELVFDRPIVGPLLIGAGRYRGYGLCRPIFPENK
jgi:CRISPR-associated protein Csb2